MNTTPAFHATPPDQPTPTTDPVDHAAIPPAAKVPATPPTEAEAAATAIRMVDAVFDDTATFESLGLRSSVLQSIKEAGFTRPTKIQALLIPLMLAGKDALGQARTGTGKTGAFGLPLLHMCERGVPGQALVLVPTRELCLQVADEINTLARGTPIKALAVYGGQRIQAQVEGLRRQPEIIVSTPGRLMDMVERRHLHLGNVKFAVLDEVDRMLDIGFRDDIRRILKMCPQPPERQTIFVSATLPSEVEKLARSHALNAEKVIAVVEGPLTNAQVRQFYLSVQPWDKRKLLLHLLTHEEPALTVVFCRTKRTVDDLTEFLARKGVDAHAMHGDMYQAKRNKIIERLHAGDLSVLVASDLASRGLDVDGITHVVNYDMPEDPEIYVHRIGRTARVGRDGVAWAFVCPDQGDLLTQVERLINAEVPKLDYPDFLPGPVPPGRVPLGPNSPPRVRDANLYNRYAATANPILPGTAAPIAPAAGPSGSNTSSSSGSHSSGSHAHASASNGAPAPKPAPVRIDTNKFPGGIVPSKLPPKRMWGKVKSAEAIKQAMNDSQKAQAAPPPSQPGH